MRLFRRRFRVVTLRDVPADQAAVYGRNHAIEVYARDPDGNRYVDPSDPDKAARRPAWRRWDGRYITEETP